MTKLYQILQDLNIQYVKYEHPALHTVEEAEKYYMGIDAGKSKSLFLRNKKGTTYYLVMIESTKRADLKKLSSLLDESSISFASPEKLTEYLGLKPGSVSPFGLINNLDKSVQVIVDKELLKYQKLSYHPNINTATLVIKTDDFEKFLAWTGNKINYLEL